MNDIQNISNIDNINGTIYSHISFELRWLSIGPEVKNLINRIYFLIPIPSFLNIPLVFVSTVLCVALSLLILRLRFARNYRLKLSE